MVMVVVIMVMHNLVFYQRKLVSTTPSAGSTIG
jgi:hypothetical protein